MAWWGSPSPRDEDKPTTPKDETLEWERRGTILGLLMDLGGRSSYQWMVILPMVFALYRWESYAHKPGFGPLECPKTEQHPLKFVIWCEYTKAYVEAFPLLAIVVLLLWTGRELLQKRYYYKMLKNLGVVQFGSNVLRKDPIGIILFVYFGHLVAHIIYLIYMAIHIEESLQDVADEGRNVRRTASQQVTLDLDHGIVKVPEEADPHWQNVSIVITSMGVPATLLIVFFYLSYDIELTLVPLSEYTHACEKAKDDKSALGNLQVMPDRFAKAVLPDLQLQPLPAGSREWWPLSDWLVAVREEAARAKKTGELDSLPTIGLMGSLWPGELLLGKRVDGRDALYFRLFWACFASAALFVTVIATLFIVGFCRYDLYKIFVWGQYIRLWHLLPLTLAALTTACVATNFARTLGWWMRLSVAGRPAVAQPTA